eukprot:GEZU01021338.1.p1 GENE.GEZU01021338.1~~GEZU01021338.1.p1  ORF type:complete len:168 (+),score=17.99 GEZU01021338.1:112-615(+)
MVKSTTSTASTTAPATTTTTSSAAKSKKPASALSALAKTYGTIQIKSHNEINNEQKTATTSTPLSASTILASGKAKIKDPAAIQITAEHILKAARDNSQFNFEFTDRRFKTKKKRDPTRANPNSIHALGLPTAFGKPDKLQELRLQRKQERAQKRLNRTNNQGAQVV